MNRMIFGCIFVVIGAIAMSVNVLFFKFDEYYDLIRRLSFASFIIGSLLIPTYRKKHKE
ncbi:hypothetical protein [Metabacillus litoralis]|uniref:hypothetical protein n=1 Tax=Metabacillus litoralis TaxID=152268 RepID=UPI001CFCF5D3|nr:hypothetical protein [Metabacillus litoralis]